MFIFLEYFINQNSNTIHISLSDDNEFIFLIWIFELKIIKNEYKIKM